MIQNASISLWLAISFFGHSAFGFDCGKAKAPVEKLICSDPNLTRLDAQMQSAFNLRKNAQQSSKLDLVNTQKKWLKESRDTCAKTENKTNDQRVACLKHSYEERLEQLAPELNPKNKNGPYQSTPVTIKQCRDDRLVEFTYPHLVGGDVATLTKINESIEHAVFGKGPRVNSKSLKGCKPDENDAGDSETATIAFPTKGLIALRLISGYEGGAHPTSSSKTLFISTLSGKVYALKDLFTPKGLIALNDLVKLELKKKSEGPDTDCSSEFKTVLNAGNIEFKSNSIDITFDKYLLRGCEDVEPEVELSRDRVISMIDPKGPMSDWK